MTIQLHAATIRHRGKEVKTMALRKRKDASRRAWDELSETDKAILLESVRHGYRTSALDSSWAQVTEGLRRTH